MWGGPPLPFTVCAFLPLLNNKKKKSSASFLSFPAFLCGQTDGTKTCRPQPEDEGPKSGARASENKVPRADQTVVFSSGETTADFSGAWCLVRPSLSENRSAMFRSASPPVWCAERRCVPRCRSSSVSRRALISSRQTTSE